MGAELLLYDVSALNAEIQSQPSFSIEMTRKSSW